jgi:hypothetical protein
MDRLLLELADVVDQCPTCQSCGVRSGAVDGFGLALLRRGHIVGVWSHHRGELLFRNVARWEVAERAETVQAAHEITVRLSLTRGWGA